MKLIFCPECEDVLKLLRYERTCHCKLSGGAYLDGLRAAIWGKAVPLGFANGSFVRALGRQPEHGPGERFDAFVIEKHCPTITVVPLDK